MDPRSAGCIPARQHIRRGLAAGLPAAVVLALLAGCATGADRPEPSAGGPVTTEEPGEAPPATPTETPAGETVTITAYYPLDTRAGFRLGREAREVPAADALVGAVETMIAGPLDPDYGAVWNAATDVQGVSEAVDGVVTVDLSADARTADVGSGLAGLMIQQLVYTVTDAARDPSLAVLLTIDGEPAGELWGAVTWDAPVTRDEPNAVRMFVQIDNLTEGATVSSPVTVSGEASAFEANVPWKVLDANGAEAASGATQTSEGQTFAPYSFEVELDPGTYTVVITEDDPSDGEGGTPMSDSRRITVE